MDNKQKPQPGRRPNVKRTVLPPGDFIALGKAGANKPRTPSEVEPKQLAMPARKPGPGLPTMAGPSGLQKRKDSITINPVPPKRTFSPFGGRAIVKGLDVGEILPAIKTIDASPHELEELVLQAETNRDTETIDGLICGAIKVMKANRLKPDQMLYLTLISLSKSNPSIFTSKQIIEHLLQFLRRENTISSVKPKPNTLLSIMTCSILYNSFHTEETWPQSFMKVYIDDALGDRAWVDNEANKDFVNNIVAVFGTKLPPKINVAPSIFKSSAIESSLNPVLLGHTPIKEEEKVDVQKLFDATEILPPQNRYSNQKDSSEIQAYVHDIVRDLLNKRQMIDSVSRNLLRFLTSVCGYIEVRLMASQRLETWLQNPKLARPAQELLMSVAMNCHTHSQEDVDVIANIGRMRLKAKPVINQYLNAIKELLGQHEENLSTILKHIIFNELSSQKNPLNMSVLGVIFATDPDNAAKHLSQVFQDLLGSREDYLKSLRGLFREIVKSLKYEVNLVEFCRGLMQERNEYIGLDPPSKLYIMSSIIDLICLGSFLCISPIVKEQAVSLSKNEKRDYSVLQACQTLISTIQRDAVWFFHTKVLKMYACNEKDYVIGLKKVLFLEQNEAYFQKDGWPPEADRNLYLQIVREVPLAEDGLLRLHLLALDDNLPINCADILDIIDRMVQRAAVLKSGSQGLIVERMEVLKMLLSLASYVHPREIPLPKEYVPPTLAISNLCWKTWLVLVILAATNQSTVGLKVWESYPTGRCLMEMLITGFYEFPPLSVGSMSRNEIISNELQLSRAEKEDILVFEGHLAAATSGAVINEGNSLLISQLMSLDPTGPPRKPPKSIIERLKILNESFQLGKLLCQSRNPDFLLSIIECQESSKGMPWLADLVQSSESSLEELPVQCLCEFLLMNHNKSVHSKHRSIKPKVAARLQDLLIGEDAVNQSSLELVLYFIERWASNEMAVREASIDAFQSIILLQKKRRASHASDIEMEDMSFRKRGKIQLIKESSYSWLHERLPQLSFFDATVPQIMNCMRKALHVETNIDRIHAYILFMQSFYNKNDEKFLIMMVTDLANMILKREVIVKSLLAADCGKDIHKSLLNIFVAFVNYVFQDNKSILDIMEQETLVQVMWKEKSNFAGKSIEISLDILQAMIALLAYKETDCDDYEYLNALFIDSQTYDVIFKETMEEIVVVNNKSLRKLLINSNNETLVKEGFQNASMKELLTMIQTFGLPMKSKRILLKCLDDAVTNSPNELLDHIDSKERILTFTKLAMEDKDSNDGLKFCKFLQPNFSEILQEEQDSKMDVDKGFVDKVFVKQKSLEESGQGARYKQKSIAVSQKFDDHRDIESALQMYFAKDKKQVSNYITLKQKLSIALIKCKNQENELANKVLYVLEKLLKENQFLEEFMKNTEACVLLNLLSKSFGDDAADRLQDMFAIMQKPLQTSHPIAKVFTKLGLSLSKTAESSNVNDLFNDVIKQSKTSKKHKDKGRKKDKSNLNDTITELLSKLKLEKKFEEISKKKLSNGLTSICKEKPQVLEEILIILFEKAKDSQNYRVILDALLDLLKKADKSCFGLLLDWIALVDSEMIHLHPTQQRELLFCQNDYINTSYFLTLLAQQSRSFSLDDCLVWLLSSTDSPEKMDASNRLKLIFSMWFNSNLWQGQDQENHLKENDSSNDMNVILTLPQVIVLIELILTRMIQSKQGEDSSYNSEEVDSYVLFLLHLTKSIPNQLKKAVNLVVQCKKYPDNIMKCFLQHLHLQRPMLLNKTLKDSFDVTPPIKSKAKIDDTIHRLVMSIAEPNGTEEWRKKFEAVDSISRCMATQYPLIYKRQLLMLLSNMNGVTRMTKSRFEQTNQHLFCNHVIELFDILREHVFLKDEESLKIMEAYVEAFLELLTPTCLSNEASTSMMRKFVEFLNHYIASGKADCERVFKSHERLFRALMVDYPNFDGFVSICTFISSSKCQPSLLVSQTNTLSDIQVDSFKQRLHPSNFIGDLHGVFNDLDSSSRRNVDMLKYFLDDLMVYMKSSYDDLRKKSYELLLRYAKFKPNASERIVDKTMECLSDDRYAVIVTAAEYAPKILTISSGRSNKLLECMYKLVTSSYRNISEHVVECIEDINIDYVI